MTPLASLSILVCMALGGYVGWLAGQHWLLACGGAVLGLMALIAVMVLLSRLLPDLPITEEDKG